MAKTNADTSKPRTDDRNGPAPLPKSSFSGNQGAATRERTLKRVVCSLLVDGREKIPVGVCYCQLRKCYTHFLSGAAFGVKLYVKRVKIHIEPPPEVRAKL